MHTQGVGVASKQEEGVAAALESCIRCTALARIVHGDSHWMLAKTHILLAKAYLELKGWRVGIYIDQILAVLNSFLHVPRSSSTGSDSFREGA